MPREEGIEKLRRRHEDVSECGEVKKAGGADTVARASRDGIESRGGCGDGEHLHAGRVESLAKNVRAPARFVGGEFARDRSSVLICALHGHRAAVGFKAVENGIRRAVRLCALQREHGIRDDGSAFHAARSDAPPRSVTVRRMLKLLGMAKADIATHTTRRFQCHKNFGNHQCVVEKQPRRGAVAGIPIEADGHRIFRAEQKGGTAISESIDHRQRTAAMEVVELAKRALDVAVVVELLQPTKELLSAVAEQRRDVMGTQKAVTPEQAQNFRVTRSEFHRQKIFRPAKTWMSGE